MPCVASTGLGTNTSEAQTLLDEVEKVATNAKVWQDYSHSVIDHALLSL